jgi:hypothetical protein
MSDAIRPPGPQYIATKQIPKVEVPQNTLDAILSEVRAGREESNQRFDKLETTVDTLLEDGKSANKRMTQIEVRMDMFEDRGTKHSSGVRHLSETDIAMLHTKVDRLTSIAERLDKVAANPMVRRVAYAVGSAILAYLATKGWLVK